MKSRSTGRVDRWLHVPSGEIYQITIEDKKADAVELAPIKGGRCMHQAGATFRNRSIWRPA
ncbi:hypothetical protein IQ22_04223 [Pseudomonas duriflava]|uniref:Uncharacterized protein n=1 Tax=Pseudomonas duriflava TaxID=459528 RepID=A0A562PV45_9PSED|nr:hypothetical protein IQ22_04223 [Pseudomonas duriflava]